MTSIPAARCAAFALATLTLGGCYYTSPYGYAPYYAPAPAVLSQRESTAVPAAPGTAAPRPASPPAQAAQAAQTSPAAAPPVVEPAPVYVAPVYPPPYPYAYPYYAPAYYPGWYGWGAPAISVGFWGGGWRGHGGYWHRPWGGGHWGGGWGGHRH
ncbi:hypothetical protein [Burkholderia metallica]|uniref:hypothetical protein n=1 Tax=Burkholderia metallica TaxID=488729 RepID=UPI0014542544|nr:hypothetical protein [Burkholderia metallica]VWC31122.1 putative lipoprotein [Burkholderia metallica]